VQIGVELECSSDSYDLLKRLCGVAAPTVETKLSVVNVIRPVAVAASTAKPHLGLKRLAVAGITEHGRVCAFQRIIGLGVVIELPMRPVDRVMALPTAIGETILVWVVGVAGAAFECCVSKTVRLVARSTFCSSVFAQQREPGQVMIKEDIVLPGLLVVAVLASRSLRALMGIVFFVTIVATRQQLNLESGFEVTGCALKFFVRAIEPVARVNVVVKYNNGPAVSDMACITGLAQ